MTIRNNLIIVFWFLYVLSRGQGIYDIEYYSGATDEAKLRSALNSVDYVIFSRSYDLEGINLAFSPNKTIEFVGAGNLLSLKNGTFRGSNTVIINSSNKPVFSLTMNFSGSWIVPYVSPDWFNIPKNGIDNIQPCLERTIRLSELTKSKKIWFTTKGDYKLSTDLNLRNTEWIDFSYSKIVISNATISRPVNALTNVFEYLTMDVEKGVNKLTIPLSTKFKAGDYIQIESDSSYNCFPGVHESEITTIDYIQGTTAREKQTKLFVSNSLRLPYTKSQNAKVRLIKPIPLTIENVSIDVVEGKGRLVFLIWYASPLYFRNVVVLGELSYSSAHFYHCYNGFIDNVVSTNTTASATGYAICIAGGNNIHISNSEFLSSGRGLTTTADQSGSAKDIFIDNCLFETSYPNRCALQLHTSQTSTYISNSHFRGVLDNYGDGTGIIIGSGKVMITNCRFENLKTAFSVSGDSNTLCDIEIVANGIYAENCSSLFNVSGFKKLIVGDGYLINEYKSSTYAITIGEHKENSLIIVKDIDIYNGGGVDYHGHPTGSNVSIRDIYSDGLKIE